MLFPRALAACDVDFEASQKFRRIESKAQRLILGTIHTSVSSLSVESELIAVSKADAIALLEV